MSKGEEEVPEVDVEQTVLDQEIGVNIENEDNLSEMIEEQSKHGQEMDMDNTGDVGEDENENEDKVEVQVNSDTSSKKQANISTDKPSSKKAKTKVEDSRILTNLIRELSIGTLKVSEGREKKASLGFSRK